jgi:hypothetical protein
MKTKRGAKRHIRCSAGTLPALIALILIFLNCSPSEGYTRYKNDAEDPGSNCSQCHSNFTDAVSTKGSVFPSDNKHEMHRSSANMNAACDLCHTNGDSRNPFLDSSNGTSNSEGLGCSGCHEGVGLRAHHAANGVTICAPCHPGDGIPPAEGIDPPYYGVTADSNVDNSCNDVATANLNENWTIGDFVGLDNDGDNLYDLADFDCGPPYRIVDVEVVGNDVQISWETVGGRQEILQAATALTNTFSDVGSVITNTGTAFTTNSTVEAGGGANTYRFYRIRYAP